MYAEVLIEYPTKKIDKYFTYLIPPNLRGIVKRGMKVKIPFNTSVINGFVMQVFTEYQSEYELKSIIEVVDPELVLDDELMDLGMYIKEKTLCPLITAYQTMLPSSLKIKNQKTNYNYYKNFLILNKTKEEITNYLQNYHKKNYQTSLLQDLLVQDKVLKNNYANHVIKALKEKDLIKEVKEQEYRINKNSKDDVVKHQLNSEQLNVFQKIKANILNDKAQTFLLEGITGSGKTEVYLNLINETIKMGKTAIMLVPEITLTMQIVDRFYEWFGSKVAIFHSALSNGEKYDEYLKIIRGEVSIVIGTRSAIFTPLKNIGLIIIDECHSETFKQDNMPRYNALDIAIKRSIYHNASLIFGSATPMLEERSRALKGVYEYLRLTKRAGMGSLPHVEIVDMLTEIKKKNFVFSEELTNKISQVLINHEQAIILLNRRGFSTTISCAKCGFTYKCPNCDITLTYHKSTNNLRCHYCGYYKKCEDKCPNCGEDALNYLGMGTEKVEMELQKLFPDARILRMDQDTTTKKGSHEKMIEAFKNQKYDILLGTQMISKGLDFPNVTLVGILNADNSLNIPDFRSNEKTFALLYQASGRAGRGNLQGNVIIQTFNPDNFVLKCVQNNDFEKFYENEMNMRRILKYPPYYYLVSLKIIGDDYQQTLENATKICDYLKANIDKTSIILGPTTANIFKLNNKYRFQIVIKYRFDAQLMATLNYLDSIYVNDSKINLEIDINPLHI